MSFTRGVSASAKTATNVGRMTRVVALLLSAAVLLLVPGHAWAQLRTKLLSVSLSVASFFAAMFLHAALAHAQSFEGLGLPPGANSNQANGVSADGLVVIGQTPAVSEVLLFSSVDAFRWTASSGMVNLGPVAGYQRSIASAVDGDGSVIVGYIRPARFLLGNSQAFRWTAATGSVTIGAGPGSSATGVSSDGSVVVGGWNGVYPGGSAFRWTAATGVVDLGTLGPLGSPGTPGLVPGYFSYAIGVSADGSVVVGSSDNQAFRWTANGGMVGLGFLGGGNYSYANGVSGNGAVVVGASALSGTTSLLAFRWTATGGMANLGSLSGSNFSSANAASTDGSVIVGYSGNLAFRWNAATGMQSIPDMLSADGVNLAGWNLAEATGVSGDGTVIVGNGTNPSGSVEGWIAQIPLNAFSLLDIQGVDHALGSLVWGGTVTNNGPNAATLSVGSDNTSTTFIGKIQDGTSRIALIKEGSGTLTLTGASTYTGGTTISAGTLQIGNGGISGSISGNVTNNGVFAINRSDAYTFDAAISGNGAFQQNGLGATTLSNTSTYTGATTVNAGTLSVTGDISKSSVLTVNVGGALIGTGTVGNTQINSGGLFVPGKAGLPGTSMTVAGTLAFQSSALYLVQISPASATSANATGTASLAGNVLASFAPGSYETKQYDILHSAGLSGTFGTLSTTNLPVNFSAMLSYTDTDALLNLTATLGALSTSGLSGNQQNVATSLNNFFNGGGKLTPNFLTVFGLSGGNLTNALSQLSGQAATDGERGSFNLMTEFLGLMLDPFVDGRGGGLAPGFVPEQQADPGIALAYASLHKAPPKPAMLYQCWSVWGSAFGGSNTANGNATLGTNNVTARTYGFANGMDYHFTPDTVAGFALAGGGTNWGVAPGLGGGRSDAFQAGIYGTARSGSAYLAAALAFANNWMTTNRIAVGDQLTAKFDAQSYGARLEVGYRYWMPLIGVTPYAAVQAQNFHAPNYSETDLTGGGFGLSYNALNATDTRSEFGARFDKLQTLNGMPLTLHARAAWAHDWVSNPSLMAMFQALPGASFLVNGATPPRNSALATVGAELRLTPVVSLLARFDGEFANSSQTYAGTGTLSYTW
jgi:autotransporter-associated beta strand protein/probable HAF family extracellular repeat protein